MLKAAQNKPSTLVMSTSASSIRCWSESALRKYVASAITVAIMAIPAKMYPSSLVMLQETRTPRTCV